MIEDWKSQNDRWERFEAWENERLRRTPRDYAAALAWMTDAWELAGRANSHWGSRDSAEAHWAHLTEIQRRLELAWTRA